MLINNENAPAKESLMSAAFDFEPALLRTACIATKWTCFPNTTLLGGTMTRRVYLSKVNRGNGPRIAPAGTDHRDLQSGLRTARRY